MSNTKQFWALPDGISEALPTDAARLEQLRRELLDLYANWGYQLVMPPLVEYLESLSIAQGSALDLQTFKLTDQLNGRMMGVRADMTPQVARMDAHKLAENSTNRLCYIGSVLHTRGSVHNRSRTPLQLGAELFGHAGIDSDFEVMSLLLQTLQHCQVEDVTFSLGHVGIFRGLVQQAGLNDAQEQQYFSMLERKSLPELEAWLAHLSVDEAMKSMLAALPRLQGNTSVLQQANDLLFGANVQVTDALHYLQQLASQLQQHFPACRLYIDLAELNGYDYHTGVVYAVYVSGSGHEIARGGRYDGIGEAFGQARPATGFSTDLRLLANSYTSPEASREIILAPVSADSALEAKVRALRQQGRCVIRQLSGQSADSISHSRQLLQRDGDWIIE